MKSFDKLLSIVKLLVEERAEDVDLVCQRWVLPTKLVEPKPRNFSICDCRLVGRTYLRPNSMSVSLRYSSGCSLLRSLCMMLSAPVPVGGYIRTLNKHNCETVSHRSMELTLHLALAEPVVEATAKPSKFGLRTVSQSGGEAWVDLDLHSEVC